MRRLWRASRRRPDKRRRRYGVPGSALSVVAALAVAACGSTSDGGAPAAPDNNDNIYPTGQASGDTGVLYNALVATESRVYACTAAHGLQTIGFGGAGVLQTLQVSGDFELGRGCRDIVEAPDGVLVATGQSSSQSGSWIAVLGAGDTLSVRGSVAITDALVESVAVTETHVYAMLGQSGIRVYGRNDGSLAEVGRLSGGFDQALGGAIWGTNLVVANGQAGLAIVDVSDPTQPTITASVDNKGQTARRIVVRDDIAYVASVQLVVTFDLSAANVAGTRELWVTHGQALDIALGEAGLAYVANLEDVAVLDLTDRTDPRLVGTELLPTTDGTNPRVVDIATSGALAFAAEWSQVWGLAFAPERTAPDIRLAKPSVDFGLVTQEWKGKGLIVSNIGVEDLEISEISTNDPRFEVEVSTVSNGEGTHDEETGIVTLFGGGRGVLQLVYRPTDSAPAEAKLTLMTNDPDEATVVVGLRANSNDGIQVGGPFDPNGELVYDDPTTGNAVTVKGTYPGQTVLLAYFATW